MTATQRTLARHALGLPNKRKTSCRNHFCTGPGTSDYPEWMAMVAQGEAIERKGDLWGGDSMFHLTFNAALAARESNEHLSREDSAGMRSLAAPPTRETKL